MRFKDYIVGVVLMGSLVYFGVGTVFSKNFSREIALLKNQERGVGVELNYALKHKKLVFEGDTSRLDDHIIVLRDRRNELLTEIDQHKVDRGRSARRWMSFGFSD